MDAYSFVMIGFLNATRSADAEVIRVKRRLMFTGAHLYSHGVYQYDDGLFGSREENLRQLISMKEKERNQ